LIRNRSGALAPAGRAAQFATTWPRPQTAAHLGLAAAAPAPSTATQTIDTMNKLWGRHPGMRAIGDGSPGANPHGFGRRAV